MVENKNNGSSSLRRPTKPTLHSNVGDIYLTSGKPSVRLWEDPGNLKKPHNSKTAFE